MPNPTRGRDPGPLPAAYLALLGDLDPGTVHITEEAPLAVRAETHLVLLRAGENGTHLREAQDLLERMCGHLEGEEREAFWEELYAKRGFAIWLANYRDLVVDPKANEAISEFIRKKIRERVKDPATAEQLCPKNHGFGTRRVPMETHYYEVYNQPNVTLVDLRETPIERITNKGIETTEQEHEFDIIIYATGFDAVLGGFNRMDIRGVGGVTLKERWADGPRTNLGMQVHGFPNMFMLVGPHNAASFCNIPRCIEQNVEWVSDFVQYMTENGIQRAEATEEAEDQWTEHVSRAGQQYTDPPVA